MAEQNFFDESREQSQIKARIVAKYFWAWCKVIKRYIKRNYKQVLTKMEAAGKIKADPPAEKRQKRQGQVTFGDGVMVTFPKKATK
jgi:hypothetical protein